MDKTDKKIEEYTKAQIKHGAPASSHLVDRVESLEKRVEILEKQGVHPENKKKFITRKKK